MHLFAHADGCTRHFRKYVWDDWAPDVKKKQNELKANINLFGTRPRLWVGLQLIIVTTAVSRPSIEKWYNNKKKEWRKFMKIVRFDLLFFSVPSRLDADEWFRKIKFALTVSRWMPHRTAHVDGKSVVPGRRRRDGREIREHSFLKMKIYKTSTFCRALNLINEHFIKSYLQRSDIIYICI